MKIKDITHITGNSIWVDSTRLHLVDEWKSMFGFVKAQPVIKEETLDELLDKISNRYEYSLRRKKKIAVAGPHNNTRQVGEYRVWVFSVLKGAGYIIEESEVSAIDAVRKVLKQLEKK